MSVSKNEELITDLFLAIEDQDVTEVKNLLNSGVCPNAVDETGRAPLHHASINGDEAIVVTLIESGANLDQGIIDYADHGPEMTEFTPLDQAAWNRQYHIIEKLVLYGANINITDAFGNTLLMRAIQFGDNILANKLITLGADINATNFAGSTALHFAVEQTNREITKTLVQRRALIATDQFGATAVSMGAKNGLDILITRIQKDYTVNKTNVLLNKIFKDSNSGDVTEKDSSSTKLKPANSESAEQYYINAQHAGFDSSFFSKSYEDKKI